MDRDDQATYPPRPGTLYLGTLGIVKEEAERLVHEKPRYRGNANEPLEQFSKAIAEGVGVRWYAEMYRARRMKLNCRDRVVAILDVLCVYSA